MLPFNKVKVQLVVIHLRLKCITIFVLTPRKISELLSWWYEAPLPNLDYQYHQGPIGSSSAVWQNQLMESSPKSLKGSVGLAVSSMELQLEGCRFNRINPGWDWCPAASALPSLHHGVPLSKTPNPDCTSGDASCLQVDLSGRNVKLCKGVLKIRAQSHGTLSSHRMNT